jgi:hypothetical protein
LGEFSQWFYFQTYCEVEHHLVLDDTFLHPYVLECQQEAEEIPQVVYSEVSRPNVEEEYQILSHWARACCGHFVGDSHNLELDECSDEMY